MEPKSQENIIRDPKVKKNIIPKVQKDSKVKAGPKSQENIIRCFACNGRGHKALDFPSRALTSRKELILFRFLFRRSFCYKYESTVHDIKDCRNLSPRLQLTPQGSEERGTGGTSIHTRQIACTLQALWNKEKKVAETGMDIFELKIGEKIKVLNGACMEAKIKDNFPLMSGKVRKRNVDVLQESVLQDREWNKC